jgi:hypothetical protein
MQYSMFHKTKTEEGRSERPCQCEGEERRVEKKTPVRRGAKESCERRCSERKRRRLYLR